MEKSAVGFALFSSLDFSSSTDYEDAGPPGLSLGPGLREGRATQDRSGLPLPKHLQSSTDIV